MKLNQKIIKDMCGTVSFKRGDSFYRANKVLFEYYNPDYCQAVVNGSEEFHVIIEKDVNGDFCKSCSCPSLASFQKDCQHIAAVLLAIYEHQQQGTNPIDPTEIPTDNSKNEALTEGLLTLFHDQPRRPSGHQLRFENRKVLDVLFTVKPVSLGNSRQMFSIEATIGVTKVQKIRDFLKQVMKGNPFSISNSFTYKPNIHCFQKEVDVIIQHLIQLIHDEKVYVDTLPNHSDNDIIKSNQLIIIPPSSLERLLPFLIMAPFVKLEYDGKTFDSLRLSDEITPLQFYFRESNGNAFHLEIEGFNQMIVLNDYHAVLAEGNLIQLKKEDCKRLSDLKQMLDDSGTNYIPISSKQLNLFLEKVVPGLKKLGNVQLSEAITNRLLKTPLIAKLYLDRVKNRLLAGLEFNYENFVITPLENREIHEGTMIIRDIEKEDEILQLMDDSSFAHTEGGYFLQNEELEYDFLYHTVPKLQKLVQIYATTAVRNRIFRGNARPKIKVKVNKERTNWLEFKFELAGIPENQIREVLQALEEKRKYYRLRNGSLLSLEDKEFNEINRFLHALPSQIDDLENGLNMPITRGLPLLDSVYDGDIFNFEESFRNFLETIHNPDKMEFKVPQSLEMTLRNYQKYGYKWMKTLARYGFGGILADDMGLGKTLQSITFILSELPNIRHQKLPALIVCPSSLTYNWLSEMMKFAPNVDAIVVDGKKIERSKIKKSITEMDVVITSYPLLRKDINWLEKQSFHTVFFDEAQAFKNPLTQTAKAVKKIQAKYRFALTGTPVENSSEELWSIFHVVFPELFQGLKEFSNHSNKTIARRIRPFLLRRLKEDVLQELPEKFESIEQVELLPEQKKLYAAYLAKLRHDTLKHLDKDTIRKNRIKILAGITRLRQICCHPALFVDGYKGSSAKFKQLLTIIEESKLSGKRLLIFSQFTKMLEIIGRELAKKGLPFFYLNGQTQSEKRVEICSKFNEGERDIFLISMKAGGTGLNLTGADTVILYDTWWNPAVEAQATDRAHRIGQQNNVQIIKLVAQGTIEEKMNELQEKKRHLIKEIIDCEEKASSTLTEEDIQEILMS